MNDQVQIQEPPEELRGMVTTTLGNIKETDLRITVEQAQETPFVWVWVRDCFYIGTEFPDARETSVRRDVWVTMKSGQVAKATSEL
jgi:hypothetical protein